MNTHARVVVFDWSQDPDTTGNGWIVDIRDMDELYDTSSRWFPTEQQAVAFAAEVAALLIIPMEKIA